MANYEETKTDASAVMNSSEETQAMGNPNVPQSLDEKNPNQGSDSTLWKRVSLAGITGVFLGTGSAYGASILGEESQVNIDDHSALKIAEVSNADSFGNAYAAARAQIGPGGVFHWRGGIYSTYSEDEWNDMTKDEKDAFAQKVAPEIRAGEGDSSHYTSHSSSSSSSSELGAYATAQHHSTDNDKEVEAIEQGTSSDDGDVEVQVLGVHDVEMEGHTVTVGAADVDDVRIYVIDVNQDGTFDYAAVDRNHNDNLENSEIEDISAHELRVADMQGASVAGLDDGMNMAGLENDGSQSGIDDGIFSL